MIDYDGHRYNLSVAPSALFVAGIATILVGLVLIFRV